MKMKLGFRQGINIGSLGASKGGGAAPATYTISGTVYDADGSTAVQSATVALGAYNATSAADGTYTISNIPAGTSGSMTCTKTGYSWTVITVAAMSGNLTGQNYINAWYAPAGTLANCKLAYKAIGAASQAASYVNIVNPGTNDLTLSSGNVSWTSANGWDFAATGVLTTGYTPPNQVTRSAFARFNNAGLGSLRGVFGAINASVEFGFRNSHGTNRAVWNNGTGGALLVAPDYASGVCGIAGLTAYANGSSVGSITAGTYDLGTAPLVLGDYGLGTDQKFNGREQAFVLFDVTLTPTAVSILTTAMTNLT